MQIETERLEFITDGDKALQRELLGLYLNTLDKCINAINSNIGYKEALHELKGASANLGFREAADFCKGSEAKIISASERAAITSSLAKFRQIVEDFILER